jgi:transposase-like protein
LGEWVLYNWVRKSKAADGASLEDLRAVQAEVVKLNAELRRNTEDRDILKIRSVLCEEVRVKYVFMTCPHWP